MPRDDEMPPEALASPGTAEPTPSGLPESQGRSGSRGSARILPFKGVYDRHGYYEIDAMVLRSARGVVVVAQEDLYRPGDLFYLLINGKTACFIVDEVRRGMRPEDAASTHVLQLTMAPSDS